MFKFGLRCLLLCFWFFSSCPSARALIIINEFLADPPGGLSGDANADGTGSTSQDEFVELFNTSDTSVDISGWTLSDEYKVRHVFPAGSVILAHELFIVFGGGSPAGLDYLWQVASTGALGLNNSGDVLVLSDDLDQVMTEVSYGAEANSDQSLVRDPETDPDAGFVQHTQLADASGLLFSPGFLVSGSSGRAVVPEPLSLFCLGWGMSFSLWQRRKLGLPG